MLLSLSRDALGYILQFLTKDEVVSLDSVSLSNPRQLLS